MALTGARVTTALPAAPADGPAGQATLDDVTLSNAGLTDGSTVVVAPGGVEPAPVVRLTGSTLARAALTPDTVRVALLGGRHPRRRRLAAPPATSSRYRG